MQYIPVGRRNVLDGRLIGSAINADVCAGVLARENAGLCLLTQTKRDAIVDVQLWRAVVRL